MRPVLLRFWIAFVLLPVLAAPALADKFVLDGGDVTDWASTLGIPPKWAQKSVSLHPNALLKFDLSDITPGAQVVRADLHLFVERPDSCLVSFWHVTRQNWMYGRTQNDSLFYWKYDERIAQRCFRDTTMFSIDVTRQVVEEMQAQSGSLSIKITGSGENRGDSLRIASPLAPLQRMRPWIYVETLQPGHPMYPDLTVSTADIRFFPMRPAPGQAVTINADIRNIGVIDSPNASVAFYDGAPPGGTLIGTVVVPAIPKAGGVRTATVTWPCVRGLREIWVVVDPMNLVIESDENNNRDFRSFWVTDPADYETTVESFESPSLGLWQTDFEVPQHYAWTPRAFHIYRSAGQAYHGDSSLELFLDGGGDDGDIWIERAFPADPHTTYQVKIDWEFFRYLDDSGFFPRVYAGVLDPEKESDLSDAAGTPQVGWALLSYSTTVKTGPYDQVYVAVGINTRAEYAYTFYIDLLRAQVSPMLLGSPAKSGPEAGGLSLSPSFPNPSRGLATIAFQLDRGGPVSLRVYDTSGRLVKRLLDKDLTNGFHQVRWDGTDDTDRPAASGVYLYRLDTPSGQQSRKLMLIH